MKRSGLSMPQVIAVALAGGLVLAGGVWGVVRWSGEDGENTSNLPEELTVASLTKQAEESPEKLAATMMNTFRRDDLTEEQRRQARRNIGQLWRSRLKKSVDEYFSASEEEKAGVLDRQIDAWQEQAERWRQTREDMRKEREARRKERGENGDDEESWQERRSRRARSQTREERKARSEGRDPDQMARRVAYFTAVTKRAQERGIEMPGRGGPGSGGRARRGR